MSQLPSINVPLPHSLSDVRAAVEAAFGAKTFRAGDLRDAFGGGRLSSGVRAGISRDLLGLGLGHYPKELPDWQDDLVRVYKLGSPIADLIDAVLEPSIAHDEELRQAVAGDAAEIVQRIRDLVCP
jgi:hypothetical protein